MIAWNTEYGNDLNKDLTEAWGNALAAAQRYGSYVNALNSIDADIEAASNTGGGYTLGASTGGGSYNNDEMIRAIVKQMKQNSAAWRSADTAKRSELASKNQQLGARLRQYIPDLTYDPRTGEWYIDSSKTTRLYDRYHSGGIVGRTPTLKQNETIAVLENGEAVLTQEQENSLFHIVDFMSKIAGRFNNVLTGPRLQRAAPSFETTPVFERNNGVSVETIQVTAPIQVVQRLDREELQRVSALIGEYSVNYIKEGFTKRGVQAAVGLF